MLEIKFYSLVFSRLNDFGLLVALDEHQYADGEVYWDDGELDHVMSETYLSDVIFAQVHWIGNF